MSRDGRRAADVFDVHEAEDLQRVGDCVRLLAVIHLSGGTELTLRKIAIWLSKNCQKLDI